MAGVPDPTRKRMSGLQHHLRLGGFHHERRGRTAIVTHSDRLPAVLDRAPAHCVKGFWLAATTRRADLISLAILVLTIVAGAWDLLIDPVRAGLDTLTFFWPTYAFLGDQLRSGNVPGWNPYQFSGVPFAADPESGWMYVPAMLIFTLMPLAAAIKVYAVAHILIAGCGTYFYGRIIGLVPAGALVSAWAVSQGGLFSDRSRCCYTHIQVAAWIPIALLGVELAVRAVRHRQRMLAWLLTGFAICQMLSGWIGQGAMYGLMFTGAYVFFRTAVHPPAPGGPVGTRFVQAARHGLIPLMFGAGFAAPGMLPRFGYYGESNLAEGYSGSAAWAAQVGGWTFGRQLELLFHPSGWFFLGATVIALGFVAIFHPWNRHYVVFFLLLTAAGFTLGLEQHTALHRMLFAILPAFEDLHTHFPERVAIILPFGPAMLAGIGMTNLLRDPSSRTLLIASLTVGIGAFSMRAIRLGFTPQSWAEIMGWLFVLAFLVLAIRRQRGYLYRLVPFALLGLVLVELQIASITSLRNGDYARVEAQTIAEPNRTAEIIMAGTSVVPPRYFGYDPALSYEQHGETTYYRHAFQNDLTFQLLVNNRGTLWNLADIQGYNPLQLNGYVAYLTALNGAPQEYHGGYILPGGLDSPLLPLLAPEFVVVPFTIPPDRPDLRMLVERYPEVAATDSVRVLRFTGAFPRAWIVHDVRQFDGDMTAAVSAGPIDFRRTALVEENVSPLGNPGGTVTESATITKYSPDALTVEVMSDGAGLLVLSEMYAEGWTGTVDGVDQNVIAVNGALRGIHVPSGQHTVTLSFEPPGLETGYGLGLVTVIVAGSGVIGAMSLDRRWDRSAASEGARSDSPAANPPAQSPASLQRPARLVARLKDRAAP